MNKLSICVTLSLFAALPGFAEDAAITNKVLRHRTPEERQAYIERSRMIRFGGYVRKEDSAKGMVVFLNAQKKVSSASLASAMRVIEEKVHPRWEIKDVVSVKVANPSDDIRKAGGEIGVVIVEADDAPALVVAPEAGWAVVNVTELEKDCSDAAKLAARTRKEVLRGFALISGAAFMARDPEVMRADIRIPSDLDMIKDESFGVDICSALERNLPYCGVTPWRQTTYRKACEEGWAPRPKNEYQKKIWDKIKNGQADATDPTNRWKRDFPGKK